MAKPPCREIPSGRKKFLSPPLEVSVSIPASDVGDDLTRPRAPVAQVCTLGDGVIVGQGDWQGRLDDHRQAYAKHVVASADFAARFPATQTAALRKVAESDSLRRAEPDPTFVLMEHFGYWRRDPDEAGSNFWLTKLEQFGGNYSEAEMVKAFLSSIEHRRRFA